ncbi:glycosyltransferase family 9 protein [Dyella sp. KRB-257]|uniref:glycosyltransferase family 9 protein n=1 Tax=Dyella sp. KRB-257 TaxID=3400915 RepID=UPI003C03F1D8
MHRILVLRPNHRLGNTLLITPLLCELERHFPGAEVDVVTGCEAAGEVFAGFRQVRRIHQLTRRPGHHPLRLLRLLRHLRRNRYDLAIDCARGSRSGRWLARWSGARQWLAPPSDARELDDADPAWREAWAKTCGHFALDAVHALHIALATPDAATMAPPRLRIRLGADECRHGRETLADLLGTPADATRRGPVVAVFPNATGSKRLPGRWWQEFIDMLAAHDPALRVIEMVAADGKSQLDGRFPAFYSSDIRRMAALIAACDAYISADCGVMHLACAAGTPTLGLFTRPNLARYRPYGPHDAAVAVDDNAVPTAAAAAAIAFLDTLPTAAATLR